MVTKLRSYEQTISFIEKIKKFISYKYETPIARRKLCNFVTALKKSRKPLIRKRYSGYRSFVTKRYHRNQKEIKT